MLLGPDPELPSKTILGGGVKWPFLLSPTQNSSEGDGLLPGCDKVLCKT